MDIKCSHSIYFVKMLSRTKPAVGPGATTATKDTKKKKKMPTVEEFLDMRDYTGAITLLEVSCLSLLFPEYFCREKKEKLKKLIS